MKRRIPKIRAGEPVAALLAELVVPGPSAFVRVVATDEVIRVFSALLALGDERALPSLVSFLASDDARVQDVAAPGRSLD